MVSQDFQKQVAGYGLTTALIEYFNPDAPWLINANDYTWQNYDVFPDFPELKKFLYFWQIHLDGPLYRVTVAHCRLIKPAELKAINGEFRLH